MGIEGKTIPGGTLRGVRADLPGIGQRSIGFYVGLGLSNFHFIRNLHFGFPPTSSGANNTGQRVATGSDTCPSID
jgi:hypothetical protein